MLAHTGLKMEEIKALGVAIGPGSFTALRVGLSFVKGLAFARGLAVASVNTLDVIAAGQSIHDLPMACLLPAGRARLALGWYHAVNHGWQAAEPGRIVTAEALSDSITQDSVVCGDLTASERQLLKKNNHVRLVSPARSVRRPAILAELAYTRWQSGKLEDVSTLAPLYLHIAEPVPDITGGSKPA
jgi:tRNA threonylcarbamoyladenosine biosynthesis protein TsaB